MRLASVVVMALLASVALADAGVRVWDAEGSGVSRGSVQLPAPPERVFRALTNYAHWPRMFSSVGSVDVLNGGRERAKVRFTSSSFDRPYTLALRNDPPERVSFSLLDGLFGTRVEADLHLKPVKTGTRVDVELRTKVGGPLAPLFPDALVSKMRMGMLENHLREMSRAF